MQRRIDLKRVKADLETIDEAMTSREASRLLAQLLVGEPDATEEDTKEEVEAVALLHLALASRGRLVVDEERDSPINRLKALRELLA